MASELDQVVKALRSLYKTDMQARATFEWMAGRKNNSSATSIERFTTLLNISTSDAVALARRLTETGCGEYKVGRHGNVSRFEWWYSSVDVGRAARGDDVDLGSAADADEDVELPKALRSLTIPQAKQALSESLGVPIENIEIIVKG